MTLTDRQHRCLVDASDGPRVLYPQHAVTTINTLVRWGLIAGDKCGNHVTETEFDITAKGIKALVAI